MAIRTIPRYTVHSDSRPGATGGHFVVYDNIRRMVVKTLPGRDAALSYAERRNATVQRRASRRRGRR